ncbi:transglutaminase-like domain-containing protein [Acutalibacter caecimuris]|uniref:transglutaminase-like domain-containing protein n=1 Tax=Acutalibacter caecimuris TaxID=3093657 RepID=UPI002AC93534|nr:transglutaminase-like domain-containing protein [Acutalibacter sp. M00118]
MEKAPQNIQLDRPRLLLTDGGPLRRWFFYAVLLLLGGLGGWGCFITAFALPVTPALLGGVGFFCCAFTLWRQLDTRKRWWSVSLLGWVAWLFALLFLFDHALHGAVRTLNAMLDLYSNKLSYDLPTLTLPYTVGVPRPSPQEECDAFFALLFYPFFWAMSRMLAHYKNVLGPFALTGTLLVFPLSFSILPAGWAFGTLLLFWCVLLFTTSIITGRQGLLGRHNRYRVPGIASARPAALLVLPLLALCMLAVYRFAPPETYARPLLVEDLRYMVENGFGAAAFIRGGQGNSNRQVQLNTMGSRSYTGETILQVKFDWQQPSDSGLFHSKEYLKSFVGSVYTGQSWERLPDESRREADALPLQAQNQVARYHQEMFLDTVDRQGGYTLSLRNLGANPRCVYIPYGLSSPADALAGQGVQLVEDGYAKSASFLTGAGSYTLDAVTLPMGVSYFSRIAATAVFNQYGVSLTPSTGSANSGTLYSGVYSNNQTAGASTGLWNQLVNGLSAQAEAGGDQWPEDLYTVPADALASLQPQQQVLAQAVEAYNQFVYRHYTQIPPELEEFLSRFRTAYALHPYTRDTDYRYKDGAVYFAGKIQEVFQSYFTYSLSPPTPAAGQDFARFFLEESHEGYCVHFATAAVLLLRSAGYPARYAEGYVVPSRLSGWVDVPDYNSHAWVEVYCGGMGWIPVEVTPASADNPAVYYDAALPGGNAQERAPTPQPAETRPTLPPPDPDYQPQQVPTATPGYQPGAAPTPAAPPAAGGSHGAGPSAGPGKPAWPVPLALLGLLAAAAGSLLLFRWARIRRRQKALSQRDRDQAALGAYAFLLRLYSWEALCGRRAPPPTHWKALAEKARFSKAMLTPEELAQLTGDIARLQQKLRVQLPLPRKALCWACGLI